jgi:hypothetical protein
MFFDFTKYPLLVKKRGVDTIFFINYIAFDTGILTVPTPLKLLVPLILSGDAFSVTKT